MDTVYYDLSARRIKVSGGSDLIRFVPTPVEAPQAAAPVLDFDRCRRKLERRAALEAMEREEALPPEERAPRQRRGRRETAAGILELCASAAVILVALAAAWAFLGL